MERFGLEKTLEINQIQRPGIVVLRGNCCVTPVTGVERQKMKQI